MEPTHVHSFDTMKGDGLGWRCGECGALKADPPPGYVWKPSFLKTDHEHEYDFLDRKGWHCRVCGAIKEKGT